MTFLQKISAIIVLWLIILIGKIHGSILDLPLFKNIKEVAGLYENRSRIAAAENRCSIFNQTDADIFMQENNENEIFFSGCEGFF